MPIFKVPDGAWDLNIREDFSRVLESGEMSDVLLVCKDGSLPAHGLVLASISRMLGKALADLVEKEEERVVSVLLPDVAVAEVKVFLNCLYGDDLARKELKDIEAVKDIFALLSGVEAFQNSQSGSSPLEETSRLATENFDSSRKSEEHKTNILCERSEKEESQSNEQKIEKDESHTKENLDKSDEQTDNRNPSETTIEDMKIVGAIVNIDSIVFDEEGGEKEKDITVNGDKNMEIGDKDKDIIVEEKKVIASRYLGRQERAERLEAKLESQCEFCKCSVASHRFTVMVKEKVGLGTSSIQLFEHPPEHKPPPPPQSSFTSHPSL